MNISASSSTATTSYKHNSAVDSLQRVKADLTNQLQKVNESKEDSKTKAEKIKQINQQIAEIEQQIQQAKIAEKQQEIQEAAAKNAEKTEQQQREQNKDSGGVILSASLNQLVSVSSQGSTLKNLDNVRTKLKREIATANTQIHTATSGSSTTYQMDTIVGNTAHLSNVELNIAKTGNEINKGIKKSIRAGTQEAEKSREAKNKQAEKPAEQVTGDAGSIDIKGIEAEAQIPVTGTGTDDIQIVSKDEEATGSTKQMKSINVII